MSITPRHPALMLLLLSTAQLIIALDATIVFVALPVIGEQLAFASTELQWVINAYVITFGGFLLLGGRCADLLGRRRMYCIGQALFAISSLVGGLTDHAIILVLARAMQGLGGALLFPATLAIINTQFAEGASRTRAMAIWSMASVVGLALGVILGGVLTQYLGWEAIFLVNVPLALFCAIAANYWIPNDSATLKTNQHKQFDTMGAICVTLGCILLVYFFVEIPAKGLLNPIVLLTLLLSILFLGLFILIEYRTTHPLMPLHLFGYKNLRVSMYITAIFMASFNLQYYFLSILYQEMYHYSTLQTGLAFLPATVVCAIGVSIAERLLNKLTIYNVLILGLSLGLIGFWGISYLLFTKQPYIILLPAIALINIGQGITWTTMWINVSKGINPDEQGVATGMASTAQQMGGALGLAILVVIATWGAKDLSYTTAGSIWAIVTSGFFILLGILLVIFYKWQQKL